MLGTQTISTGTIRSWGQATALVLGRWSVLCVVRMAFGIRDNHEMGQAKATIV